MMEGKAETLEQAEAFNFYYALGKERSLRTVAREKKKALSTIKAWSGRYEWARRVVERDAGLAKKMEAKTDKQIVDRKTKFTAIIEGAINRLLVANIDKDGNMTASLDPDFMPRSVSDLDKLVRLYLLMNGEADSRPDVGSVRFVKVNLQERDPHEADGRSGLEGERGVKLPPRTD